ncbi:RNA-directed DNA polymerase from transposon X-element [Paramuricea clavata]|uniref:RNA-directed DNA polymerase from transposon X-element n=1 Tax=Paramuricea clavata TaxID=317549 RepID=A0A6S7HTB0_PARCT|nr:RNA-directed DNA polymerase from transposon X-element [Paramuricea clavata]
MSTTDIITNNYDYDCDHDDNNGIGHVPGSFCTSTFNCGFSAGDFVDITPTRRTKTDKVVDRDADDDDNENEVDGDGKEKSPELFSCPTEGCIKNYHRYSSLESHLEYGVCKLQLERQSLLDKAKAVYVEKLLHRAGEQPVMKSSDTLLDNRNDMLPQGWALRTTKSSKPFNKRQKSYLNEKFNIGNETGHKLDPVTVSQDMRFAKDQDGNRRFTLNEFLTPHPPQQIQSYFSRKASKQKKGQVQPVDRPEDRVAAEDQEAYSNTRCTIVKECQLIHPIVYDSYNLCNLVAKKSLKKFSASLLRVICEHFHIDVSVITAHLQAPYIALINDIVQSCSCSS